MTINYQYHKDNGYLHCVVNNKVTLTDVLTYIDKIINDQTINEPFFEIVDFSNTMNFDFGYYQSDELILKLKKLKSLNNYQGSLLITDRDYLRGMANIFQVIGEDKEINVKAVASLEEAINFVKEYFA